jgi:hypothetical protein
VLLHHIVAHLAVNLHAVIFTLMLQSPQMYTKHSNAWVVNCSIFNSSVIIKSRLHFH